MLVKFLSEMITDLES